MAIIGAGVAGMTLGHRLSASARVKILEAAPEPGGRLVSHYAQGYTWDYGAQFFRVRSKAFKAFLAPWLRSKYIQRWNPAFAELSAQGEVTFERQWDKDPAHYVGNPDMQTLAQALAQGLPIELGSKVAKIERASEGWELFTADGASLGVFDWVLCTLPPAQAQALMPASFAHRERLSSTQMLGCYALMLALEKAPQVPWQAAVLKHPVLSWAAHNSSKASGLKPGAWITQARNSWAQERLEVPLQDIQNEMLAALEAVLRQKLEGVMYTRLHRWHFANIGRQEGAPFLLDLDQQLAACGDWCIQGRIESAFLSASHLAQALEAPRACVLA